IGLLSLSRPVGTFTAGEAVTLTGTARAVKGPVVLEQSDGAGGWAVGPTLTLSEDSTFSVSVIPTQTTRYRLARPGVQAPELPGPGGGAAKSFRRLQVGRRPRRPDRVLASSFVPTDPLVSQQWYLARDHAFDFWTDPPTLPPVLVAVIDTGIDLGHP